LEINGDCSLASGGSEAGVSLNLWQSRLSQLGDSFWHVGQLTFTGYPIPDPEKIFPKVIWHLGATG
jgi:hypothetical protein